MNIWIKSNKSKTTTFEIAKNAIFRFYPRKVEIVNFNKNNTLLNMIDLPLESEIELNDIIRRININDFSHYGKLKTIKDENVIKTIQLPSIKKMYWINEQLLSVHF